ncbi:putative ERAD-associated E3 ubiquitin-protein ligase [Trichinella spiralis]|uniref:ERAD-associated E3 ubiquitin-protein ligase n=1 Tax=Trichinella spiralis TaxID=6334 RepID=A0ABR3KM28_TRISP
MFLTKGFVFRASTVEIEANPRSPLLDINTDNQMITAEQNENRSQSNNNAYTNNVEELEAKVSMLEMENYELKAKLRENQHFIRNPQNSQMKQDVQKKYEELSSELYKAYLELQKVRSELAHSKSMQNNEDGHQAEKRQTENMDNMVREIDALKASLDRETSRADWYHGEVEYFRRRGM